MSKQRLERRDINRGKKILEGLVNEFFISASQLKDPEKIRNKYTGLEAIWKVYVGKQNASTKRNKPAYLNIDAFESTLMRAHRKIKRSDQSYKTKLQMMRCLRPIQGKWKAVYFVREFPLWVGYLFKEFKATK